MEEYDEFGNLIIKEEEDNMFDFNFNPCHLIKILKDP